MDEKPENDNEVKDEGDSPDISLALTFFILGCGLFVLGTSNSVFYYSGVTFLVLALVYYTQANDAHKAKKKKGSEDLDDE